MMARLFCLMPSPRPPFLISVSSCRLQVKVAVQNDLWGQYLMLFLV